MANGITHEELCRLEEKYTNIADSLAHGELDKSDLDENDLYFLKEINFEVWSFFNKAKLLFDLR